MNSYGEQFRVSVFGESHGAAIGVMIDGVPAGIRLDMQLIQSELERRAPGRSEFATPRKEDDVPEILSGVNDGVTEGSPIVCLFANRDTRSRDYPASFRPGHADLTAYQKYKGFADMRGGGHFSGRLTAGLVFAGAIAKQILKDKLGSEVFARMQSIGGTSGNPIIYDRDTLSAIAGKDFPSADEDEDIFKAVIREAKEAKDSVGGAIEAVGLGLPAGLGEPFFGSVESHVAAMLFSIPAVKGVEFGAGFGITAMRGSEANDPIIIESVDGTENIITDGNNSGGILGGISNGMPIVVRVAIKPTASIGVPQRTVEPSGGMFTETELELTGRHDPCILPRAVPVIEAGIAIALLDLAMEGGFI